MHPVNCWVGVSFINLPFSAWMGARALLTVCRFENLVTGLNLLKQFEFHVKAPLTAHICSASRSVPPSALLQNIGCHGGSSPSLGAGDAEKGQGKLGGGGVRRKGKEGRLEELRS